MRLNATMKYLASYKEKVETFTVSCTLTSNVYIIAVHEFLFFFFSLLCFTLTKLKVTKIRIGVKDLRTTAV